MKNNLIKKLIPILIIFNSLVGLSYAQESGNDIVIGKTIKINSKILNEERTVQVALPVSYTNSESSYPVVFVLDGGMNFKFTADIARYLAVYSMIPELIVVGISSSDRNKDFIPSLGGQNSNSHERSGNADNFLKFIENEIIPFIDKNYRTLNYRVVAGHSLGGLFVIHSLIEKPTLFDGYIASSPSIYWNNNAYFSKTQQFYRSQKTLNKSLFVTLANESEDKPEFYTQLKESFENNIPEGLAVQVKFYMDKNHFTSAVESTLDGLGMIFSPWVLPGELVFSGDVGIIKNFYKKLSDKLGFKYQPSASILNDAGYRSLRMGSSEKAIAIFKYNVELYPNSANAYDSLAEAYMLAGNKELAIKNYEKSLELNPKNTNAVEQIKKLKTN